MNDTEEEIVVFTVDKVAEMLKVSKATIYKYAAARIIKAFKIGTAIRFYPEDIKKYLETQRAIGIVPGKKKRVKKTSMTKSTQNVKKTVKKEVKKEVKKDPRKRAIS
jgi:excisionase family DNA binding protein